MKKLQFLENDYKCPASDEDIRTAQRHLRYMGIDVEKIEEMPIHYQFGLLSKDEAYKIIFDSENILVTYSMYISGSDSDFLYLIAAAGRNQIKNITYIDTSGQLVEFLNRKFRDDVEGFRSIIAGINTNNILTFDYECEKYVKRVKIQFTGMYDDCVVLEDVDINNIW